MAVTLAVFAAVQIIMPNWVRPHLIPPAHATTAVALAGFCVWWIRYRRLS